ncbi:GAF domain-containing protein [Paenibacillus sp. 481]|uniref:GAF domain-containing protein n=1 Tax=Paenibacillus sp. 481 TaxID=2835869 RepID=UPI001E589D7C|nr:GAF domain-containing protein [Paenibacillus sp. 481]UHA73992.1 GAF domain-containing protein [Paenibacillus sp. 481]
MEAMIRVALDKLPPWAFHLFAIVIAVGIAFYFIKTLYINKKFSEMISDIMNREDRTLTMQTRVDELREAHAATEQTAQQSLSALRNMKPFVDALNDLRALADPYAVLNESTFLMQRMLDMLAVDMKASPGGHHRCGVWLATEQMLTLRFASAGFPKHYVGERQLHVDRSIAGRSFRKQVVIQCVDVTKDEDWERNVESKSPYRSLISIPLGEYGVLTMDGLQPFSESCRTIGEMYAAVATGVIAEHVAAFVRWSQANGVQEPDLISADRRV